MGGSGSGARVSTSHIGLRSRDMGVALRRERCERLAHENRVLRREQRGGRRDEVVLQLETELAAKEQERADMEESLSRAFGGLLQEANTRVDALTVERDRLLVSLEEASVSKRGFFGK